MERRFSELEGRMEDRFGRMISSIANLIDSKFKENSQNPNPSSHTAPHQVSDDIA